MRRILAFGVRTVERGQKFLRVFTGCRMAKGIDAESSENPEGCNEIGSSFFSVELQNICHMNL